jgi:hypothetical protein
LPCRVWTRFRRKIVGQFEEQLTFRKIKGLEQPPGTNLYGFYVYEFIRWYTNEQRARSSNFDVRKEYSHFSFIIINCVEFHPTYIYIHIVFLKLLVTREKLLPTQRIKAIQEELAGFLLREVLHEKGEHYMENDEHYI